MSALLSCINTHLRSSRLHYLCLFVFVHLLHLFVLMFVSLLMVFVLEKITWRNFVGCGYCICFFLFLFIYFSFLCVFSVVLNWWISYMTSISARFGQLYSIFLSYLFLVLFILFVCGFKLAKIRYGKYRRSCQMWPTALLSIGISTLAPFWRAV